MSFAVFNCLFSKIWRVDEIKNIFQIIVCEVVLKRAIVATLIKTVL